jgi:hypothetical protein
MSEQYIHRTVIIGPSGCRKHAHIENLRAEGPFTLIDIRRGHTPEHLTSYNRSALDIESTVVMAYGWRDIPKPCRVNATRIIISRHASKHDITRVESDHRIAVEMLAEDFTTVVLSRPTNAGIEARRSRLKVVREQDLADPEAAQRRAEEIERRAPQC